MNDVPFLAERKYTVRGSSYLCHHEKPSSSLGVDEINSCDILFMTVTPFLCLVSSGSLVLVSGGCQIHPGSPVFTSRGYVVNGWP